MNVGGVKMKSILLVYATISGNTEILTETIAEQLQLLGYHVEIKAFDFDVIDIDDFRNYSAVLIGSYTWDDGEIPYEVEDFYIDLANEDIEGLPLAVYGAADSCYDTYGQA